MACALICKEDGGATVKTMEIAGLIVTTAVTVFVGSAVAAAVMLTVPPVGTVRGAVNVVVAPLAVCVGLKEPQLPPLHDTVQSTPRFCESLATVALIMACAPTCMEGGGAIVKPMEITGAVIATVAVTVFVGSAVAAAVIITVPPVGIAGGAV
jgi:hypothetical protein